MIILIIMNIILKPDHCPCQVLVWSAPHPLSNGQWTARYLIHISYLIIHSFISCRGQKTKKSPHELHILANHIIKWHWYHPPPSLLLFMANNYESNLNLSLFFFATMIYDTVTSSLGSAKNDLFVQQWASWLGHKMLKSDLDFRRVLEEMDADVKTVIHGD